MAALPLNTAPHFIFYYRFCKSVDFYCSLNPRELFLSFSRTFSDYQGEFFKIQGQFKDKLHFFRIPGVFKDQGHFQGLFKVCANPAQKLFPFSGYIVQGSKWKATKAVSLLGVYCPGKHMESHKSCFPLRGILSREANGKPQKLFPFVKT